MRYDIEVTFKRKNFKDKTYKRVLNLNYNDETFQECENMIRDQVKDIANCYIEDAFYG